MSILDELAAYAQQRVKADLERIPLETMIGLAAEKGPGEGDAFQKALEKPGLSFICEVKRASPSKGLIAAEFPYVSIAESYEAAGADCISCLTEPNGSSGRIKSFRRYVL